MTTSPTWIYKNEPITEIDPSVIGFVYVITQISTGMRYFGKKKAFFKKTSIKTVTLKNGTKKKKKIRSLIPSDWPEYYGSSNLLLSEVEKCGVGDFTREILEFCASESMLSYTEAKIQFEYDVLLHPELFFNRWIMVRCRGDNLIKSGV
jgi:Putative endonuclease segE, GIY-YIG domain